MSTDTTIPSASDVARELVAALDARGQEYALGGAITLGFWGEPRGTLDVDVTLFLPPDKPSECLWLLQDLGRVPRHLVQLYGLRDHRVSQWEELVDADEASRTVEAPSQP